MHKKHIIKCLYRSQAYVYVCPFQNHFRERGFKNHLMHTERKHFYTGIICYEYVRIEFKLNMCINFFLSFINILHLKSVNYKRYNIEVEIARYKTDEL